MKNARGFTLLETMVTVAIMAILGAMTFALITNLTKRAEVSNVLGELSLDINGAKMRAAQRGCSVAILIYHDTDPAKWHEHGYRIYEEQFDTIDETKLSFPAACKGSDPCDPTKVVEKDFKHMPERRVFAVKVPPDFDTAYAGTFPFKSLFTSANVTGGSDQTCSFCLRSGSMQLGLIRAFPDGRIWVGGDNALHPNGGVIFATSDPSGADAQGSLKALGVIVPSGITHIF